MIINFNDFVINFDNVDYFEFNRDTEKLIIYFSSGKESSLFCSEREFNRHFCTPIAELL